MEKTIKESEADKLSVIEVKITGITDVETAINILTFNSQLPEGFDSKNLNPEISDEGITLKFPICCWRTEEGWVYGFKYNGLCHYAGKGCPA